MIPLRSGLILEIIDRMNHAAALGSIMESLIKDKTVQ